MQSHHSSFQKFLYANKDSLAKLYSASLKHYIKKFERIEQKIAYIKGYAEITLRKVGLHKTITIEAYIICETNRFPPSQMGKGQFWEEGVCV